MNENQKQRIEEMAETAKKLRMELIDEWANETNIRRQDELMADAKRMAMVTNKCKEILERGKKCGTDTKKPTTSTKTQDKYTETKI